MTRPYESVFPWAVGDFSECEPEMREGMTKRELFAAMAMQGLCADPQLVRPWDEVAGHAVRAADSLIAALNKEEGTPDA